MIKILLLFAIASNVDSIVFTCYFYDREWSIGDRYTCQLGGVENLETAEITQIIEHHTSGRNRNDVKAFDSSNEGISTFPKGLEKFFPNLDSILLRYSFISISSADLRPWPNLVLFWSDRNPIESLDEDLFQNSPKLHQIGIVANSIKNVGRNLFSNLNELTSVYFDGNPCIDIIAETPEEIENLKTQLITSCPPLETPEELQTTTESDQCKEAEDLRALELLQTQKIAEHKTFAEEQIVTIQNLEKIFDELKSKTCSCSDQRNE